MTTQINEPGTNHWRPAIPEPFYWGLIPWVWKRLTGWRDRHGRKAYLLKPWDI